MNNITLKDRQDMQALAVLGGTDYFQNAKREYLEFVFPKDGNTAEGLEEAFSSEACEAITLTDEGGESFIHSGYVLRGTARIFQDEQNSEWKISVRRYQQTALEREIDELRRMVHDMAAAKNGA